MSNHSRANGVGSSLGASQAGVSADAPRRGKLTASVIDAARPKERPYKLGDSQGLYLFVTPAGSKSWRLKYRFRGKEHRLTFGLYPSVSAEQARAMRDRARILLDADQDPRAALQFPSQREAADYLAGRPAAGDESRVYFIRAPSGNIKIGVSLNVERRLAQLQLGYQLPLTVMGTLPGGFATEGMLHRLFCESAVGGEWFKPSLRLLEFIDENAEAPQWL